MNRYTMNKVEASIHLLSDFDLLLLLLILLPDLLLLSLDQLQLLNIEFLPEPRRNQITNLDFEHQFNRAESKTKLKLVLRFINEERGIRIGGSGVTSSAETEISLAFSSAFWRMNLTIC